jgi:hypothetical protein
MNKCAAQGELHSRFEIHQRFGISFLPNPLLTLFPYVQILRQERTKPEYLHKANKDNKEEGLPNNDE